MSLEASDQSPLSGKFIVLGVSGSIAAYKAADLTSDLRKAGAQVSVVMTESATRFISPLTLRTLSRNPVAISMWDEENNWVPGHVELADQADLFLVAPATANQLANFARGQCADLLGSIYLATRAPILVAPAMNGKMYEHPATLENLKILSDRGVHLVEPVEGELACGYEGVGKLAPVNEIVERALGLLAPS